MSDHLHQNWINERQKLRDERNRAVEDRTNIRNEYEAYQDRTEVLYSDARQIAQELNIPFDDRLDVKTGLPTCFQATRSGLTDIQERAEGFSYIMQHIANHSSSERAERTSDTSTASIKHQADGVVQTLETATRLQKFDNAVTSIVQALSPDSQDVASGIGQDMHQGDHANSSTEKIISEALDGADSHVAQTLGLLGDLLSDYRHAGEIRTLVTEHLPQESSSRPSVEAVSALLSSVDRCNRAKDLATGLGVETTAQPDQSEAVHESQTATSMHAQVQTALRDTLHQIGPESLIHILNDHREILQWYRTRKEQDQVIDLVLHDLLLFRICFLQAADEALSKTQRHLDEA